MKKFNLLFFAILFSVLSFAQGQFSSNEDEFLQQVQTMMKDSKNEKLIQIGEQFSYTYGDLTSSQKEQILKLSNSFKSQKQKTPIYGYFYGGIIAAKDSGAGVSAEQLTSFLTVCDQTFEKDGASKFQDFIKSASKFFIDLNLYKTKYYSYQIEGGNFMFEYAEQQQEEEVVTEVVEEKEEDPFGAWDNEDSVVEDEWVDDGEGWGDEEEIVNEEPKVEEALDLIISQPIQMPITGPVIKVENVNIIINSPSDSGVVIEKTSGSYMLLKNEFAGEGGTFDWTNGGHDEMDAIVTLGIYNFKTNGKVNINSEGSKLNYPIASSEEVEGVFGYREERLVGGVSPSFPRFMSYKNDIEISNIGEGIEYFGGLSLNGNKQSSASVFGKTSTIIVSKGETEKFRARAKEFNFKDSIISSSKAYVLIHVNEDSIIHYGMTFKYNKEAEKLTFFKGPKIGEVSPFFDTQHNVEISAEKLSWNINEDDIDFSMVYASSLKAAKVESIDFYTENRFSRLQGLSRFHPLTVMMYYSNKNKVDEFFVTDLSKSCNQPVNVLKSAMSKLSTEGYISYSPGDGKIIVKRKAKLYAAARREKTDWDQFLIYSKLPSRNITYNIPSGDLTIRGVDEVMLSVPQNVKAIPDSGIVILKGNRDLFFDGKIFSGQFQFTGKNYRFDYDSFFVDMSQIDSIRLLYNEIDSTGDGEDAAHTLGNKLVYASGVLYVDRDNNKSHKKNFPEYPIFDATTGAYVYFDDDDILDHAYDTTIYFRIPPFTADSLNETDPNTVSFKGTFYGGNILEPFDETLKIMPDYSFGFVHESPKKGHDLYGGKGKLFNTLTLNKQGLRANGEIQYLSTNVKSSDFVFYLDSAITDSGSVAKMEQGDYNGVLYPPAYVSNYSMNWKALDDKMHISNRDSVIDLYEGKASLDGTFTATPTGTLGSGKALSGRATTESKEMSFSQDNFEARNANFYVRAADDFDSLPTIKADSVFLDYNMIDQYADFGPEIEGYASVEFPFMQYKTSISNGRWDMVENIVTMVRNRDEDIEYSYFYSTHPDQDSLAFNADSAVCDLDASKLEIFGVPFIKVADSKIVPDSNKVYVLEDADIQSFENAMVYIDTLNEYHTLDSGQVDIISRYAYAGEARYQYVNALEDTFYIDFNAFRMERFSEKKNDKRLFTMSDGYVMEEDSFFISPRIQYYGDVELDARENFLYFNGFVKIDLKGGFLSDWFKFDGRINPSDVKIEMTDPKSSDGTPLVTGLHIADGDSAHLYSTFIALKEMEMDFDVMKAKGVFGFNPYKNEFRISDEDKENEESLAGNVLVLNDSTSEIRYEGAFEFVTNDPKSFEIKASGNGEGNIKSGEYNFHTLLTTYFKIPGTLTTQMADIFTNITEGYPEPFVDDLTYRIADIAGDGPAQLYSESRGEYIPLFSVSNKLNRTLVFSDLELEWSNEYSSFYSPKTLGLSNILKYDINSQIDGFLEFKRTFDGEEVNIYLQPDSSTWFYFNYFNHTLSILSSDLAFNALTYSKSTIDKRSAPEDFAFGLADFNMKEGFNYHYKKDYYNEKLDSIDPMVLTELQANLLSEIQNYITGGSGKKVKEEVEGDDEDIFFDDNLEDDLLIDEDVDSNDKKEKEEKKEDDFIEEDEIIIDDLLDEELAEEDPWSEANEKIEKKKKKGKSKKEEDPIEEEIEDEIFEEDIIEEEEPKKEKKKKEEVPIEKEVEVLDEDLIEEEKPKKEKSNKEEEPILEEEISDDDPWSEANEKIEKKKKKEKNKKEEDPVEDELLDSFDEELDDL